MSVKRFLLAGGALALLTSSANAALTFSLERVASNDGAVGPSTVLLVARDPDATTAQNIAGLSGRFTDLTTGNGLKFLTDPDSGDVDLQGGVGSAGFTTRRPVVMGSFLDVPGRTLGNVVGQDSTGAAVEATNDPKFASGLKSADFLSTRTTSNTTLSVAALTSQGGAVLGAAVVGSPTDEVSFTLGKLSYIGADNNAAPDILIPNLSTADVPEPASLCFLGVLGAGTLLRRRRA